METIKTVLVDFITENFITGRSDIKLEYDESFIESGLIDSTGILELVTFIEEHFSLQIEDEELVPENLDSINNLLAFLKIKGVSVKSQ